MADLLDELTEDIQAEKLVMLWKQYGKYLIAAMVAVLLATAGYLGWKAYQEKQWGEQSVLYTRALKHLKKNEFDAAIKIFDNLTHTSSNYQQLASLQKIATLLRKNHVKKNSETIRQAKLLTKHFIEDQPFSLLKGVAVVGLNAGLLSSLHKDAAWEKALADYVTPTNPWKGLALEIQGSQAYRRGNLEEVQKIYQHLFEDADVSKPIQQRAILEAVGLGLSIFFEKEEQ